MVTKKDLLKQIDELKKQLEESNEKIFNALKGLNNKINKHIKGEKKESLDKDVIKDWLTDPRVDEVQSFINKGVK